MGVAGAVAAEALHVQPWIAERKDAVLLARRGETAAALTVLERLRREHPEDIGVAHDLVVVTAWAGHTSEAIRLFAALPPVPPPDYVIMTVALAHRHLKQPAEALALYRRGLRQSPDDPLFAAGEVRSLADTGEIAPAIAIANNDLRARGERTSVLLAAAYAALAWKKPVEALRYIDRALKLDPLNREAVHDRILAISAMGAPQVALRQADEHPGVVTAAEIRRIDGDAAAALVRWGVLESPSEELRFAATDRAIVALDDNIARWSREGDVAQSDVLRARLDRMIALRDRVRMADVLSEYDDLRRRNIAVPSYVLVAVGDAYLYFRQPETARALYLQSLAIESRHPESRDAVFYSNTRAALFYAYVALDDFGAAYRIIDAAAADQAIWRYLKGLSTPLENPERATADLVAANARVYADELAEAHRRMTAMVQAAPNNTHYISALANIYSARGWPRLAAEEYEISRALRPRGVTTEVGQARNNLQLRDYRAIETQLAGLKRRFPENLEVRRLDRLWQVHNMAEFSLNVEQALRSATNIQGGTGIAIDAQLYSAPIQYNWRIFGAEYVAHEQLTEGEGAITLRRSAVGAEYRGRDLIASLEGTISAYGPKVGDTLRSDIDQGRGGVRAIATWSMDDYWEIGGGAEIFARDTPLRALRHGVTANAASFDVAYRESESRKVLLNVSAMDFSDGNMRTGFSGRYVERLTTRPRIAIDGIFGLAGSRNSADTNRPYYNPRQDALATFGVSIDQSIYRRYEFIYDHHLIVTPGVYWEHGFGAGGAGSIRYEHRVRNNDVLEAALGVNVSRQPYDGKYENTIALLLSFRHRF